MGSIGSSMSPSARMTAASGIARQRATWPSCARSPSTSWGGTEHPGSACGRVASRPPGTMITCSLFWLADFMRRPWQDTLAFQVDLWSARGELPGHLAEVVTRQKEIQYSSRTRANTDHFKHLQRLRCALASLLAKLPDELRDSEEAKLLSSSADHKVYNIVQ